MMPARGPRPTWGAADWLRCGTWSRMPFVRKPGGSRTCASCARTSDAGLERRSECRCLIAADHPQREADEDEHDAEPDRKRRHAERH